MKKWPRLRYTRETVANYWEDPNYRVFCIEQRDDDTFCYVRSNETNNRLYGNQIILGKDIREFMSRPAYETLYLNYGRWISQPGIFSYLALLQDGHTWETTIETKGRFLYGIGTKCSKGDTQRNLDKKQEPIQEYSIQEEFFFCIMVSKTQDSYLIESIDGRHGTNDILKTFIGYDLMLLFQNASNVTDCSILDKCLSENKIIQYLETVNAAQFTITAIPLSTANKVILKGVLLDTANLTHLTPQKNRKSFFYPTCTIIKNEMGAFEFVDHNALFEQVVIRNGITIQEILQSAAFQTSHMTLTHTFGTLQKEQNGEAFTLFLEYVPTIYQGHKLATLCYLSQEKQIEKLDRLRSMLSKRESEIFSFLMEGYSNLSIAHALCISIGTVKKLVYNCFKKLGVSTRYELVEFIYSD